MKLLKKLYTVHSPSGSEESMRRFIQCFCKRWGALCTQDNRGNLLIVKGESETYPCIVAHMDEVHTYRGPHFHVVRSDDVVYGFDSDQGCMAGIGADDKNGIWIALQLLMCTNAIKIALFVSEEVGCLGSREVDLSFFDNCRFVIQCDRCGSCDFIRVASGVELCSSEFIKLSDAEGFGYRETTGFMTDVRELRSRGLKLCCANLSCGYYHAHTGGEFTRVSELYRCLRFVKHIVQNVTTVQKYEAPKVTASTSYGYSTYNTIARVPSEILCLTLGQLRTMSRELELVCLDLCKRIPDATMETEVKSIQSKLTYRDITELYWALRGLRRSRGRNVSCQPCVND